MQLLQEYCLLSKHWLTDKGWFAIPKESTSHFSTQDAAAIAKAVDLDSINTCFAVAAETLKSFPRIFEFEASLEGFLAFSNKCSHFNFLIIPQKLSFGILCTTFDYYVVAGSKRFVENATSRSINQGRSDFERYANESEDRIRLGSIARYYAQFNPVMP